MRGIKVLKTPLLFENTITRAVFRNYIMPKEKVVSSTTISLGGGGEIRTPATGLPVLTI